jgi:hypothetical protein
MLLAAGFAAGGAVYLSRGPKNENSPAPTTEAKLKPRDISVTAPQQASPLRMSASPDVPKLTGIPVVEAPVPSVPKPPLTLPPALPTPPPTVVAGKNQPLPGAMASLNPDPPERPAVNPATEREIRMQELLAEVATEQDPHIAQRTQLTIAGYQVGNGDWTAARKTFFELTASPYPEVRYAALRNLEVADRNLELANEQDAERREWLQLNLAQLHQNYGHEKTAKTMLRSLQANATQQAVREQAAQRLATYVVPSLPTLPEPVQSQGENK